MWPGATTARELRVETGEGVAVLRWVDRTRELGDSFAPAGARQNRDEEWGVLGFHGFRSPKAASFTSWLQAAAPMGPKGGGEWTARAHGLG